MLSWCSYCQQFLGEVPPYADFAITHEVCTACGENALALTTIDLEQPRTLKTIQDQLFDAGRRNDLEAASRILEESGKANMRELDFLMGIIAPLLYRIGEDWASGCVTVAAEHRFTAFCEKIFAMIADRIATANAADAALADRIDVLLINAPGNRHTLALRILALWLMNKGLRSRAFPGPLDLDALVGLIRTSQPRLLLVSMTLAEQFAGVVTIADRITALPAAIRPELVVGGHAVKLGLVPPIPGAKLVADISDLALCDTPTRRPDEIAGTASHADDTTAHEGLRSA